MQRKISEVEHKLTALYALDALGAITNLQLLQFMVESELMDYITMQLALYELEMARYIKKTPHPLGALCTLTPLGKESLALFIKRIPDSKMRLIDASQKAWRKRFAKEKEVLCDVIQLADGRRQLEMKMQKGNEWLLFILLVLPREINAHQAQEGFLNNAEAIYAMLFSVLSRGYAPGNRTFSELPPCAARIEGEKYLVEFFGQDFSAILPVPDGDLACHFADVWQRESGEILRKLKGLLSAS